MVTSIKCKTFKNDQDSSRTFTPLMWAVYQNLPEIVALLLEKGADENMSGCCLHKNRKWICGNAIGIAEMLGTDAAIVEMLRNKESKKHKTVIQIGTKSDWKRLVESRGDRERIEPDSAGNDPRKHISVLISNPDYLSPEEIESEKRELSNLQARIKKAIEIEEQINRLRLELAKIDDGSDSENRISRENSVGSENLCSIRH